TLAVNNLDEVGPVFTSGTLADAIDENSGASSVIYTAATDDATAVYSLSGTDASLFSINSATGEVTLLADADYETKPSYSFTVTATDGAGNHTDQIVTLAVNNLDEVAPTITSGATATAIDENSGAGSVIYTATADDSADISDGVTFSLSGDDAAYFSINSATGEVTLLADADYETKSSYSFVVTATDGAGNFTNQTVTLAVNDLDDTAPDVSIVLAPAQVQLGYATVQDYFPQITEVGSDGAYAVTWLGRDSDWDYSIFVQAFSADGSLNGTIVPLTAPNHYDYGPQITAVGSDGAYVVTWYGADSANDYSIFVQAFNADGSLNGTAVQLEALGNTTGHDFDPQITAVGSDGAYVVTWNGADSANDYSIFVQAFKADGSFNGDTVQLEAPGNTTYPQITAVGTDGAYVVTWYGDDSDGDYSIFVQAFKADGSFNGDTVQLEVPGNTTADDWYPQITAVGTDGAYVVTWYGADSGGDDSIFVQAFDADGSLSGTTVQLEALGNNAGHDLLPQITSVGSDGAYVVTWYGYDGVGYGGNTSIFIQAFNAEGSLDGSTVQLEALGNTTGEDYAPQITAVGSDGAYVVTWYGEDSNNDYSVFVQAFDADGSFNGATVQLEALGNTTGDDYDPQITAVGSDGAYVVTWYGENSDGNNSIFMQAFNADGSLVMDSTYETGELVTLQSSEAGTVYLVSDTVTVTSESDITSASSHLWVAATLAAAGTVTVDTTALAYGDYYAYAVDNAGNLSLVSDERVTLADQTAPTFTSDATIPAIDENSGENVVIYTATTDDAAAVYSLSGTDASLFSINSATGEVTLLADADYETKSSYSFTVTATDGAGNHTDQTVTLAVNNLDEVAPTITSGDTATAIDENSGAGQVVYTATADDSADISDGVSFSLSGTDASLFSINSVTGEVTLLADADYETKSSYNFTVIATDGAGHFTDQTVTLAVNNLDEAAPTITSGDTATAIDENSGASTVVYTATADDSADISDGVSFSLSGADAAYFSIDASTGEVTLLADADYETKSSYSFTVTATDGAGNYTDQTVTLTVNNLDELAPTITSGAIATAIDENSGAGQVVYTAAADDSADISSGVSFSLSGDDAAYFSINSATGEVTLLADADYETKDSYNFTVTAIDGAGNHTDQIVTLAVNNLDEVAPTITSGATATAIDENSGAGQVVYTAAADDSADISSGVSFLLSGDDAAYFSIDASTGEVTLLADADYETKASYSFIVTATDGAGNHTDQIVTLAVNNLDEIAPTITSGATATSIDENSGAGQVVYTATADDSADISDGVSFSLSGTDASLFSINSVTGEVTLLADADYETKSSYNFTVIATDGAGHFTDQTVTLAVNNLDEAAPTITSGDTATAIDENSGASTVVYTATADDSADISDGVSFSLSGADAAYFSIDASTGEVTLLADADYETKPDYSFTVVATDGAGNVTDQAVTLAVNNFDDTAPVISSGSSVSVDENTAIDSVIHTVTADDSGDISGGVTFSLSGDDAALFSIDASTGDVSLNTILDAETRTDYSLIITVTDAAGNYSSQAVALTVNDLDESAPTFTSGAAGYVVSWTTADDGDGSG
ncbi:cadherin domain-containing protein, partial [Oceanobacter sp. 5_MG-2023]|uniref:beta strand repeat-containing protein n=1 Tax=Oceanobacter sp. 5_MG-2023 TaxID=3062645 RepID=UPI0026E22379